MDMRYAMGWIPDYPDFRDFTEDTDEVKTILEPTGLPLRLRGKRAKKAGPPAAVDLREWCSPVEDQGALGSCTAHAVVAIGYNDQIQIKNKYADAETAGALLIRNSWGKDWGEGGYGWLPYEYLRQGLAEDFWSVLKKEWIDTGEFRI